MFSISQGGKKRCLTESSIRQVSRLCKRSCHPGLATVGAGALAQNARKPGEGAGSVCARPAHWVSVSVVACHSLLCTQPVVVERPEHVEPTGGGERQGHLRARLAQAAAAVVSLAAVALWRIAGGATPVLERANEPTHAPGGWHGGEKPGSQRRVVAAALRLQPPDRWPGLGAGDHPAGGRKPGSGSRAARRYPGGRRHLQPRASIGGSGTEGRLLPYTV